MHTYNRRQLLNLISHMIFIVAILIPSIVSISLPLHNGIYSPSGSYTATIQVGTPSRPFEVQIDTGSHKLVIPCVGCDTCNIQNALFDYSGSLTYSPIPCADKSYVCDECQISAFDENICILNITYYDNSSMAGRFISDHFRLPGLTSSIQTIIGCKEQENQAMASFGVQGIWGVAKSITDHNGTTHRADQLIVDISQQQGSSQRLLGLCLSTYGGVMNIGKIDQRLHTQPGVIIAYDNPMVDTITNSLQIISVGGFTITTNGSSELSDLIIDSGTTISFVSFNIYNGIANAINYYCDRMGSNCKKAVQGDSQCYYLASQFLAYTQFPPIELTFNGSKILWYAQEYFSRSSADRSLLCFTFRGKSQEGGFILGNDFMLNKDIIFGQNEIKVYQKSRCKGSIVRYAYGASNKRSLTTETSDDDQIYHQ